jgi:FkbM family methyltransferase
MRTTLKKMSGMIKFGIIRLIMLVFGERGQIWIESESLIHKLKKGWRYEKETELLDLFLSPGDVCFDIGANYGQWSYMMSGRVGSAGKVIAVEPMPITAQIFMRVARHFKFPNVSLYQLALGDRKREATMQVYEDKYKFKRLSNTRLSSSPVGSNPYFKVKMTTFDSLVDEQNITNIKLIKCDIEGVEMLFLQGAINTLQKESPIIICEIVAEHLYKYGYKPEDVYGFLLKLGYLAYVYKAGSLVPVSKINKDEYNYVFIHKNNEQAFSHVNNGKLKKVIYLGSQIDQPTTGGQKYNSKVLGCLERAGFSSEVIDFGKNIWPFFILRGIAVNINYLRRIMPLLEKDTIVIEGISSNLHAVFLNLLMKFRRKGILIGICHHLFVREKSNIFRRTASYAATFCMLRFFDAIVTVSNSTKKDLVRFGVKEEKIHVIPNATEAPQVGKNNYDHEEVRILFVGTCYPRKGLRYLLEAVAKLKRDKIKIDIVGNLEDDKKHVSELYRLVKKLGIDERVTFHGHVRIEQLWDHYRRADIFVLPSLWEGFGVVFLDAMSFGLPIVSTNVGAIPELVRHEENGLLVKPGDPMALAAAIERLVVSPSLRRKLGQNGFRFMQEHPEFTSWDIAGEKFKAVIESLIGRRTCR